MTFESQKRSREDSGTFCIFEVLDGINMVKWRWQWILGVAVIGGGGVAGFATRDRWLPLISGAPPVKEPVAGREHDDGHDHTEHSAGKPVDHVELTDQARRNLGLEIGEVTLQDYWRTVSIPGTVAEEPGHCERRISTTVNGIILKVHALQGQTVKPGDPLFDIQPTSDLLTNTQTGLLKTLQDMELVDAELERLSKLVASGTEAKNLLRTKEAEKKRLDSTRLIQMQELLVRGLSPEQIHKITETKTLIRQFTVRVPSAAVVEDHEHSETIHTHPDPSRLLPVSLKEKSPQKPPESPLPSAPHLKEHEHDHGSIYTVETLTVSLGKLVQPGEELCQLASHTVLLIEGQAFERESALVTRALEEAWPITVIFESGESEKVVRKDLRILYVNNSIDEEHRVLKFHLPLVNEVVRDNPGANGLMYRTWRFKPGQKVRLLLPVEKLTERIVLPADAVVKEGPDAYVFRQNGRLMEQVPVTLEQLDPRDAVLKNDGSLFEGDEVARNQAYQLHLALKKAQGAGGGGHHHDHDH